LFPRPSCGNGYGHNHFNESEIEKKARLHKEEVARKKEQNTRHRTPIAA
jgi:hypothetical protein